ncbi:MAG: UDP-N-acetylmuramoyl-L-alanine--D-glutamate ligase [Actinobacteria bacterium]|nr:UDP-N-acetylmuramoyl-L-alanine--D-glutamate ligase [Actinomycetota bacterium]
MSAGRPALGGRRVLVAGAGASGEAAVRALLALGALVTVADRVASARTERLAAAGADVRPGLAAPPAGTALVVTSPGWRPDSPLLRAALAAGIEVIGEVELAWRLQADRAVPAWLCLTGTNGKTTTVRMLESILRAAGHRAVATGNVGLPVIDAVREDPPYQVLAVELSSYQLYWSGTLAPRAAALLNVAEDHLDWHGSMAGYGAAKRRIFHPDAVNVVNADDPAARRLADGLPDVIGFTLGEPGPGQLGVRGGRLVDRAFGPSTVLAAVAEVRPAGPHNVANALAAAALARAYEVPAGAVAEGLRTFVPDRHRNEVVAEVGGVTYVDDSKATNPHAAAASLAGYHRVVWIAGGQLKGAHVDGLLAEHGHRLVGAVLLGTDQATIAGAITRHAPDLPVHRVASTDDGAMIEVVRAAAGLARPGDVVLLAPAAASLDMFASYGARGDAFAAGVRDLPGRGTA